jgi:hypothetical protein
MEVAKYGRAAIRCQWGLSYKSDRHESYSGSRWVTLQAHGFHTFRRSRTATPMHGLWNFPFE